MSWLKKLLGKPAEKGMEEHLVRLHIPLEGQVPTTEEFDCYVQVEDKLDEAAQAAGVGELDGNEIGGKEYTVWLYGADGAKLAEVVKAALTSIDLPKGAFLFVRYGGVEDRGAREERIPIS